MPTILVASIEPGAGRTTVVAGLGPLLAETGRTLRLLRMRSAEGADAAAEDDARTLALVPGCVSSGRAVTEQDTLSAADGESLSIIEAPAGDVGDVAARLSARVVLVTPAPDELSAGEIANAAGALGDRLAGVVVTRQPASTAPPAIRGVTPIAVLPEDRLLAGPTVHEMADALHASRLFEGGPEDEAVEFVMLGPITADPGQPYFLQHGGKAVINRFDKMDLHLAALATEPDCVILTGGQMPSPYFLDRLRGSDLPTTVLLAPEGTVATAGIIDELYAQTRFGGARKIARAVDLFRAHGDSAAIRAKLS